MQYALVDGRRSQASKGIKGICEQCKSVVIAKCGVVKLHHWSHQRTDDCDRWWEAETIWHREWKNLFPEESREILFQDESSGEAHRADIHSQNGITIEFQHSHIDPQEQLSRENFYKNLVWVVNGGRLKRDFPRFAKESKRFLPVSPGIFRLDYAGECFPQAWVNRSVPVIFDYSGAATDSMAESNSLYCLIPLRLGRYALVARISRTDFVKAISNGDWLDWLENLVKQIKQVNLEREAQQRSHDNMRVNSWMRGTSNPRRWRL